MKDRVAYDDAVDLLDADHKAVKKMFIDHAALCDDGAPAAIRHQLAQRICQALSVHAQIEEEIFYPLVRAAIPGNALLDEALQQHDQAKQAMARIDAMQPADASHDDAVRQLGQSIDQHVLEERERIFLKARQADLDLRGMTLPLLKRKLQLMKNAGQAPAQEST